MKRRWFEIRAGKFGIAAAFYTLGILFVTAKLGADETGAEALWYGVNPIVAILITAIPFAGGSAYMYFAIKNV